MSHRVRFLSSSEFEEYCLPENGSIRDLMRVIDAGGTGFAVILGQDSSFKRILTDGDVRRAMLKGLGLDDAVSALLTKTSFSLNHPVDMVTAAAELKSRGIRQLPVIGRDCKVEGIYVLEDFEGGIPVSGVTGVVLAGGRGERLRPETDSIPKPLIEVNGKPLLAHCFESFERAGICNVVVSVRYLGGQIQDYVTRSNNGNLDIEFVEEENPLGTAGPLSLLELDSEVSEIVVANADVLHDIDLKSLLDFHRNSKVALTAATVNFPVTVPFGVVSTSGGLVRTIEEKPTFSYEVLAGIYVVSRHVLSKIQRNMSLDMPELILELVSDHQEVATLCSSSRWLDVGTPSQLEYARRNWASV